MAKPNIGHIAPSQPSPHLANPMQPSTVSRLRPKIWRMKSLLRGKLKTLPESVDHTQVGKTRHFTAWRHPGHWIVPKRAQYEAWFTQELADSLMDPQSELQTCFCVSVISEAELMLPKHDLDKRPASEAYFEWVLRRIFSRLVVDQIIESILEKSQSHGVTPAYCMYVREYPISMWISQITEFLIQDSGLCDITDPMNAEPNSGEGNAPSLGFVHSRADFLPGVEHLSNPIVMSMRSEQTGKDIPTRALRSPTPPERSPLRVVNTPGIAPTAAPTEQDISSVHPALRRSTSADTVSFSKGRPLSAPTEQDISAMRAGSRTPILSQPSPLPAAAVAPAAVPSELDINTVHPALRTAASPATSTLPTKTAAGIALPVAPSWLNASSQHSPARVPTPIPSPATPATGLDPVRPVEPAILPTRQPIYSGLPPDSAQTLTAQHDITQALQPPTASTERQEDRDKGKQPVRPAPRETPSQATTHVDTEDEMRAERFRRKPAKDASQHDLMDQLSWLESAVQHVRARRGRRKAAGHAIPDEKPNSNPTFIDKMSRFKKWFADHTKPDEPQSGHIMGERELTQDDLRLRRVARRNIGALLRKLEELEELDQEDENITGQPEGSGRAQKMTGSWVPDDDGAVGPARALVSTTARPVIEDDDAVPATSGEGGAPVSTDDGAAAASTWSDDSAAPVLPAPAPPARRQPTYDSDSFRGRIRSLQRRAGLLKGHGRAKRVKELEPNRFR